MGGLSRQPLAWCAAAWLLVCALSVVGSVDPWSALFGAHHSYDGLLHQVAYVALFLAATRLEPADLVAPVCLGAALACVYVVVQAVGLDPVDWYRTADLGQYRRPFGTLGHANHAGAVAAMALPFALSARAWWRWPLVALLAVALVVTLSRAAWAGALVGVGVYAWLRR